MTMSSSSTSSGLKPTSRLIVKNLPESASEAKVRKIFGGCGGEVTDVALKHKDGKFRGFAFVGFKTPEEADRARKRCHGSFVGALKIRVEFCADLGDPNKPRAWSKHNKDSSAYKKLHGKKGQKEEKQKEQQEGKKEKKKKSKSKRREEADAVLEKYKDDPKFQEFLRIHKRNSASWDDNAVLDVAKTFQEQVKEEEDEGEEEEVKKEEKEEDDVGEDDGSEDEEEDDSKPAADKSMSDLDYLKQLKKGAKDDDDKSEGVKPKKEKKKKEPKQETYHTVKLTGLPYKAKKKDVKAFFKPLKCRSIRVPPKIKGIAYAGFATEQELKQALNKSRSILKGSQVTVKVYSSAPDGGAGDNKSRWEEQEKALATEETVAESGRLFVRNLCYSVQESELEELFGAFGPLSEVNLPVDRLTRKVKGFAFVTFMMPEHAVRAYSELDGKPFQGRRGKQEKYSFEHVLHYFFFLF